MPQDLIIDTAWHPLADGRPPAWASAWGQDGFGVFAAFSVDGVTQRLRWIPPGRFWMGSPEDEPGRWDAEGPRHQVTIAEGFWLFETPCTQALWMAVMDKNRSRFQDPERPVEQVSWADCQGFIERINARLPGLGLSLPSEAQWEYACRAGSETALYSGPIEILGARNASALDSIAWYGGNSGVDYDLEEAHDTSDWPNMQYPTKRAGTRKVKGKAPNNWGLYDMLGNVWEWVADPWHEHYRGAPSDASPWQVSDAADSAADEEIDGVRRIIRGGAWDAHARDCRCAYRNRFAPGYRLGYLGFRCARVQVPEPGEPGQGSAPGPGSARPAERIRPGRAGAGRGAGAQGAGHLGAAAGGPAAITRQLDLAGELRLPLPSVPVLRRTPLNADNPRPGVAQPRSTLIIETDQERLRLAAITRPSWADAIGRDRHGLWVEIAVAPEGAPKLELAAERAAAPARQRLRWIPPGRFWMGSPKDEPGRLDWEGPRHQVTIAEGFWLFDTPCTQALWSAVMGHDPSRNPSQFGDPERPMEQVSWADCQGFIERINARLPGLGLSLPSEAHWEYACRAGSETALYSGPIAILGQQNAPALEAIAWYGGNSGLDYDLDEAWETIGHDWTQMQYPTKRAGTRKVKGKAPNAWGLYDMLGNVDEWVADPWHANYSGAPADGQVWQVAKAARSASGGETGGVRRVIRGGSWNAYARGCRCAFRDHGAPGYRDGSLGFRCTRVQL